MRLHWGRPGNKDDCTLRNEYSFLVLVEGGNMQTLNEMVALPPNLCGSSIHHG